MLLVMGGQHAADLAAVHGLLPRRQRGQNKAAILLLLLLLRMIL